MSKNIDRKLRKGPHGYLFVQIPSKMQYKHGLTKEDIAIIEDTKEGITIKIRKNHLGERVYAEKTYSTTAEVIRVAEP